MEIFHKFKLRVTYIVYKSIKCPKQLDLDIISYADNCNSDNTMMTHLLMNISIFLYHFI